MDDPNVSPDSDPQAVRDLVDFAKSLDCAEDYLGRSIDRNTCTNDWYYDLDLRLSQELPGPGRVLGPRFGNVRDKLTLYATVDNFLNFIDQSWNIQRRRNFAGLQEVAEIEGVDDEGRYIIGSFLEDRFEEDNFINVSSSVWRVKLGISYDF